MLVGEPGIGKTTLLRGLVEQAGAMTVLETAGVESEADLPYAALIDVLKPVLHRLDALPERRPRAVDRARARPARGRRPLRGWAWRRSGSSPRPPRTVRR